MVNTNTGTTIGITSAVVLTALVTVGIFLIPTTPVHIPPTPAPPTPSTCAPDDTLVDGTCATGLIENGAEILGEITNENVIAMRNLRINDLLNHLNSLPDSHFNDPIAGRSSYSISLASIQNDTQNESVVSAINKMYALQKQFDGVGNDELLSNKTSSMNIYDIISDIINSQYKSLSISSSVFYSVKPQMNIVNIPNGTSSPGCETSNTCYSPASVTINVGNTVKWTNTDTAAHTVTSGNSADGPSGVFDSSLITKGHSFEFTFDKSGTYPYFCMVHPWMTGNIQVN